MGGEDGCEGFGVGGEGGRGEEEGSLGCGGVGIGGGGHFEVGGVVYCEGGRHGCGCVVCVGRCVCERDRVRVRVSEGMFVV